MKRLTERAKRTPSQTIASDASLFADSSIDTDFADSAASVAPPAWAERADAIKAKPLPHAAGFDRFERLWKAERELLQLSHAELERLAQYFDFAEVPAQKEVIGQNELGSYLVVLLDGRMAVDRVQPWGARTRLAEIQPGDMLGEMSLLDAGARFSACTTLTACTLAVLDAQKLQQLMLDEPRLALTLFITLSRRLSLRLRQVSARLSALLSQN